MFVDRNLTVFEIPHGVQLALLWSKSKPTLLDGELVARGDGSHAYMVFDAISYEGDSVGQQPLMRRLDCIRNNIRNPYRSAKLAWTAAGTLYPAVRIAVTLMLVSWGIPTKHYLH